MKLRNFFVETFRSKLYLIGNLYSGSYAANVLSNFNNLSDKIGLENLRYGVCNCTVLFLANKRSFHKRI